jgi:hypothetical protein
MKMGRRLAGKFPESGGKYGRIGFLYGWRQAQYHTADQMRTRILLRASAIELAAPRVLLEAQKDAVAL